MHLLWTTWLPRWHSGKESTCQCPRHKRLGFDPQVRKIPWQPTPAFLPREFQGQRSLTGYSPWGHKKSDTTEWSTLLLSLGTFQRLQITLPSGTDASETLDLLDLVTQGSEQLVHQPKPVAESSFFWIHLKLAGFQVSRKWGGVIHLNKDYVASEIQGGPLGIMFLSWF